jgi:hypothetical protein
MKLKLINLTEEDITVDDLLKISNNNIINISNRDIINRTSKEISVPGSDLTWGDPQYFLTLVLYTFIVIYYRKNKIEIDIDILPIPD